MPALSRFIEFDATPSDQEKARSLACGACLGLADDPLVAECGHVYCRRCAMRVTNERGLCCLCNKIMFYTDMQQHRLIVNLIDSTLLICKNEGCDVIERAESMYTHINLCQHTIVKCPNINCTHTSKRALMPHHVDICPEGIITCQLDCKLKIFRRNLPIHRCALALLKANKRIKDVIKVLNHSRDELRLRCNVERADKEELLDKFKNAQITINNLEDQVEYWRKRATQEEDLIPNTDNPAEVEMNYSNTNRETENIDEIDD